MVLAGDFSFCRYVTAIRGQNVRGFKVLMFSIPQFAVHHGMSVSTLKRLWASGKGPRFVYVGKRRMIRHEDATRWRKSLETEQAAVA
jgi:hypothetical protein